MNQTDYDGQQFFVPRGRMQQQQPMPQQMNIAPVQQQYMQMPQPTMPGGNYAPNGMPLQQQGNGMFGQPMVNAGMQAYQAPTQAYQNMQPQPPLPDYQKMANEFYSTQKDIRNLINDEDATENMERMRAMVDEINGANEDYIENVASGNIQHVSVLLGKIIGFMERPMEWLPPSRAKYADKLVSGGAPIVTALKKYAASVEKLKV